MSVAVGRQEKFVMLVLAIILLSGCVGAPAPKSGGTLDQAVGDVAAVVGGVADVCLKGGPGSVDLGDPWGAVDVVGRLPNSVDHLYGSGVAWDGQRAWMFGGYQYHGEGQPQTEAGTPSTAILSYLPGMPVAEISTTALPTANWDMAAVWAGDAIYLFGGQAGHQQEVSRFDPLTETLTLLPVKLPANLEFSAAVWDGTNVYLFGGGTSDRIFRFSPETETFTTLGARLPSARQGILAAWDGHDIYLFGGRQRGSDTILSEIVRFEVETEEVSKLPVLLPTPLAHGAVAWDGSRFVLMGGVVASDPGPGIWIRSPTILTYEPMALAVRVLPMWLPQAPSSISALPSGDGILVLSPWQEEPDSEIWKVTVPAGLPFEVGLSNVAWKGESAYVFGGSDDPASIQAYDSHDGSVKKLVAKLDPPRTGATAVTKGESIYVMGGWSLDGKPLDDVLRFSPASGLVQSLPVKLPEGVACSAGIADGDRIVLVGGMIGGTRNPTDQVIELDLSSMRTSELPGRLAMPVAAPVAKHDGTSFVVQAEPAGVPMAVPLDS